MKKKFTTLLLLCSLALGACGTPSSSDGDLSITDIQTPAPTAATEKVEKTNEAEKAEPTELPSLPDHASIGQIVTGDDWSIALLYAKEYGSISSEYYTDTPKEGNKFLVLFFDVKNVSKNNDYLNSLYFEGYADDYSMNQALIMGNPDGYSSVGGNIDAGKMSKGTMVFEVPADWSTFEVSYRDGIWTTHKAATFVFTREDLAAADYTFEGSVFEDYTLASDKITSPGTTFESSTWTLTYIDSKQYDKITDTYWDTTPAEGNEFVIFFLEAQNISSEDDYFNPLDFYAYADGYLASLSTLLTDVDGYSSISGDVAAGKKIKGYIALEVPTNWSSVELVYDDNSFSAEAPLTIGITNK